MFEEELKELVTAKKAEEIEIIISEISKQFKAIYGEEISDKDVIRLRDYPNVYHQAKKRGISPPPLILTRSRKSIDNKRRYEDTELVNLLNKIVGKQNLNRDVLDTASDDDDFSGLKEIIIEGYLHGEHKNRVKNELFIPINLRNKHWVLVNVVRDAKNIIYFDPLGNPIPEKLDTVLKSKNCFPDFMVMDLQWKLEKDSDNCGTWVIGFVRKLIAGVDIREKGQFDITAERRVHNQILSEASSSHPSIASLPIDSSTRDDSPDIILTPSTDVIIDHAGQNANFNSHTHSHKASKHTGGISIPVLGLTRSGKSTLINNVFIGDNSWYDDTKLLNLLNAAVGKENPAIYV